MAVQMNRTRFLLEAKRKKILVNLKCKTYVYTNRLRIFMQIFMHICK